LKEWKSEMNPCKHPLLIKNLFQERIFHSEKKKALLVKAFFTVA
jgi:hypothetical protein